MVCLMVITIEAEVEIFTLQKVVISSKIFAFLYHYFPFFII